MSYKLKITFPMTLQGSACFQTEQEAMAFVNKLYAFNADIEYKIEKEITPLYSWVPDEADRMIIESLMRRGDKIAPIKFARIKTGAGLKDAKDWVESQFGEFYRAACNPLG